MRRQFLESAGLDGVRLALSASGGAEGSRRFPLLAGEEEWRIMASKCKAVAANPAQASSLLAIIAEAVSHANSREKKTLLAILKTLCALAVRIWNEAEAPLQVDEIESFRDASVLLSQLPPMPDLSNTWRTHLSELRSRLEQDASFILDHDALSDFVSLVEIITETEPRFLSQQGFPDRFSSDRDRLLRMIDKEAGILWSDSYEGLKAEEHFANELKNLLRALKRHDPSHTSLYDGAIVSLETHEHMCEQQATIEAKDAPREPEDEDWERVASEEGDRIDVEALFADL